MEGNILGRTAFQTLVVCSILLPGCSLEKRLRGPQDYENVQGDDELDVIKDFRWAAPQQDNQTIVSIPKVAKFQAALEAAANCTAENLKPDKDASNTAKCSKVSYLYLQAGMSLSDDLCRYFFWNCQGIKPS